MDNILTDKITELQRRLDALENTNQPYVGDWQSFNASNFSYSSATRIAIANITPSDFFQVGDKLKITQTTVKYFYIVDIGSNYIDVYAGDDYTVANATITATAISKLESPSGFPTQFAYTPTITAEAPLAVSSISTSDCSFWIKGDIIFSSCVIQGVLDESAGRSKAIQETLPLSPNSGIRLQNSLIYAVIISLSPDIYAELRLRSDWAYARITIPGGYDIYGGSFYYDRNIYYQFAHN